LERREKLEFSLSSLHPKKKEVFEKRFIYPWVVKGFVVKNVEHGYKGVAFLKHGKAEIFREMDTSSGGGKHGFFCFRFCFVFVFVFVFVLLCFALLSFLLFYCLFWIV
jgi:hypothetical protein